MEEKEEKKKKKKIMVLPASTRGQCSSRHSQIPYQETELELLNPTQKSPYLLSDNHIDEGLLSAIISTFTSRFTSFILTSNSIVCVIYYLPFCKFHDGTLPC